MAHITFPADVDRRKGLLETIRTPLKDALESINYIVKTGNIPVFVDESVPIGSIPASFTTAVIALSILEEGDSTRELFSLVVKPLENNANSPDFSLRSATFGENNPITCSFVIAACTKFGACPSALADFAAKKILEWVDSPPLENPRSGYPAFQAFNALESYEKLSKARDIRITRAKKHLLEWAETEVRAQISFHHSQHSAKFDVGALAFVLLLSSRGRSTVGADPITSEATRILVECQSEDGLWHSAKPFWQISGRGCYLSSAQIMSAMIQLLEKHPLLQRSHEENVTKYVLWLANNLSEVAEGANTLQGWALESNYSRTRVDVWVTLYNIDLLRRYRTILGTLNRDDLLKLSGLNVKRKLLGWDALLPVDSRLPLENQLKEQLRKLFVEPWQRNSSQRRFAMVLYGPPGTSKTSIGEALTSFLQEPTKSPWEFVTITPGDFIAGGEQMAEINAGNIFSVLVELPRVVILFDEIDLLLRDRDLDSKNTAALAGALRFMTTSMLTKFQTLRDAKLNIFILTTNKYEQLDWAIRRAGRFDSQFAVLPPDGPSRETMLKSLLADFDTESSTEFLIKLTAHGASKVVIATSLFTYAELKNLVKDTLQGVPKDTSGADIEKALLDAAGNYPRATSFSSYKDRKGAENEIARLLHTVNEVEYEGFTSQEQRHCRTLAKKVEVNARDDFERWVPDWLKKQI